MSLEENPYLPPANPASPTQTNGAPDDDERIRRNHLNHEASVKCVGTLQALSGISAVLYGLHFAHTQDSVIAIYIIVAGALQISLGRALRRFDKSTRFIVISLAALGLFAFPLGTLVGAALLYLMLSRKGAFVFSDDYKRIIAATSHLPFKASVTVRISLASLVLVVILGVVLTAWARITGQQ
jgi:hypothetical protein